MKHKGVICGILAAVCYGTNPFGALPLYEEGVNTSSVLFYRFTMAVVILGVMLLVQRKSFSINSKELKVLLLLGVLFSASCITYYESFQVIDAGIASTILFVYPIIVALLMSLFFKERLKVSTMLAILFALGGISLLYKPAGGAPLNTMGVVLVVLSEY